MAHRQKKESATYWEKRRAEERRARRILILFCFLVTAAVLIFTGLTLLLTRMRGEIVVVEQTTLSVLSIVCGAGCG